MVVILTEMQMTTIQSKRIGSHSYRNVNEDNPTKKNMESHSHRNMHDESPYTKKKESHFIECA